MSQIHVHVRHDVNHDVRAGGVSLITTVSIPSGSYYRPAGGVSTPHGGPWRVL